jgi:hypothetical protein
MKSVIALAATFLFVSAPITLAEQPHSAQREALIRLAQASSSCQNFFSQCAARCASNAKGESQAKCTADHCRPKLASCRKSGCWTEGAAYGGARRCGLAKQ